MKEMDWIGALWKALAACFGLLALIRLFPPLRFLWSVLLILVVVGTIAYSLWYWLMLRRQQSRHALTVMGRIEERLRVCRENIDEQEKAVERIQAEIDTLERRVERGRALNPRTAADLRELIAGFQRELRLRDAKLTFFRTCEDQLETLLYNHQVARELEQKRRELEELREQRYDDVATAEQFRWDIDTENEYLDTLSELSRRAAYSQEVDDTERLRLELEQLSKHLQQSRT